MTPPCPGLPSALVFKMGLCSKNRREFGHSFVVLSGRKFTSSLQNGVVFREMLIIFFVDLRDASSSGSNFGEFKYTEVTVVLGLSISIQVWVAEKRYTRQTRKRARGLEGMSVTCLRLKS